ncbi:MAG: ADP-ribosylglycohydrolase family protein [Coraliomargarita sp.]
MSQPEAPAPNPPQNNTISPHSRFLAAWWGSFIGDALAMPVHWYYKRELIPRDYGAIRGYLAPKNPHPDSILWRSHYESTCPEDNILHDQAQYWGKPGVHYHQFLEAGENTLNLKIASLLADSLVVQSGYDPADFAKRYINFMLTPGMHRDTYVEEYHRTFFQNYGRGKPIEKCGPEDSHIGCLAALTPLVLFYHQDHDRMLHAVRKQMSLTHKGETAARAGELYAEIIFYLLQGHSLESALFDQIGRNTYQVLHAPFRRWIENHEDEDVIGKQVSTACYLEDALPATLYLALKYEKDLETGLLTNTRLGGDNCHRGAALGCILGAAGGCESIPGDWVGGLKDYAIYDKQADALWDASQNSSN